MKIFKNLDEMKNIVSFYKLTDILVFIFIILASYILSKIAYFTVFTFIAYSLIGIHMYSYSTNNFMKRNYYDLIFLFKRLKNKRKKFKLEVKNMGFLKIDSTYIFALTNKDKENLLDSLKELYDTFKYDIKYITYNTVLDYSKNISHLESLKDDTNKDIIEEKIKELKSLGNEYETTNLIVYFYDNNNQKISIETMLKNSLPILDYEVEEKEEIGRILKNLGIGYDEKDI